MWIWQQADWPKFHWKTSSIDALLRQIYFNQGQLLGKQMLSHDDSLLTSDAALDTLLANIIHSSAIEGEKLNAASVRSSLAKNSACPKTNRIRPQHKPMVWQTLCSMP